MSSIFSARTEFVSLSGWNLLAVLLFSELNASLATIILTDMHSFEIANFNSVQTWTFTESGLLALFYCFWLLLSIFDGLFWHFEKIKNFLDTTGRNYRMTYHHHISSSHDAKDIRFCYNWLLHVNILKVRFFIVTYWLKFINNKYYRTLKLRYAGIHG